MCGREHGTLGGKLETLHPFLPEAMPEARPTELWGGGGGLVGIGRGGDVVTHAEARIDPTTRAASLKRAVARRVPRAISPREGG